MVWGFLVSCDLSKGSMLVILFKSFTIPIVQYLLSLNDFYQLKESYCIE